MTQGGIMSLYYYSEIFDDEAIITIDRLLSISDRVDSVSAQTLKSLYDMVVKEKIDLENVIEIKEALGHHIKKEISIREKRLKYDIELGKTYIYKNNMYHTLEFLQNKTKDNFFVVYEDESRNRYVTDCEEFYKNFELTEINWDCI